MQPQDEYTTTTPDAVGLDAAKLRVTLDYAALDGSSSIKVFRNGCLAGQGFRDSTSDRVPELNAGQTKVIVALIAGIVSDRGWVDLDAPIAQYLPEDLASYKKHAAISLHIFMQLTSGVQMNHLEGLNFFLDISRTREYFATPFEHQPGTYYEFDEITPSVVVYVLERAIQAHMPGVDFQAFAQCELFDALGIPRAADT
jgi:CubicO group peptidase (beta-lactamase class C family)